MHWQDLQDQMKQNQFLNSILIGASDYSKECILKMCFISELARVISPSSRIFSNQKWKRNYPSEFQDKDS